MLLAAVLALLLIASMEAWRAPDGKLHVSILDVGEGDGALIRTPMGKYILIDGGPDEAALEQTGTQMAFFSRTIDLLLLTAPATDRIGALPALVRRYRIGQVILPVITTKPPAHLQEFLDLLSQKRIPVMFAETTHPLHIESGVTLALLQAVSAKGKPGPLLVLIEHAGRSLLLAGNAGAADEALLLKIHAPLAANTLVLGKHGSQTATSTGFLLAVHPSLALMSVGKDNLYRQPSSIILRRLAALHIPVRRTDEDGTIALAW